jgi:hypothetical protein
MTYNQEKLQELIDSTDNLKDCVDVPYLSTTTFEDEEELREALQTYVDQEEIIYYYNAIQYLKENDPSLNESLELASNMGCVMENLNSEILATLHYQDALNDELGELDLSECFEEVE